MKKPIKIPELPNDGSEQEVRLDVSDLQPDVEVIVRKAGADVQNAAGTELAAAESFDEARQAVQSPNESEAAADEELIVAAGPDIIVDQSVDETETQEKPEPQQTEAAQATWGSRLSTWRKNLSPKKLYKEDKLAGITAGITTGAVAAPMFLAGSGFGATSYAALGLTGAALALPYLGYIGANKKHRKEGAALGAAGSAAMLATGTVGVSSLTTVASALAWPAAAGFIGYKIGKNKKRPYVGAAIGTGVGLATASAVSGGISAVAGGGWSALGGAALGLGSGAGLPLLAGAGVYGGIRGGKWAYKKWKNRGRKAEDTAEIAA